MTVNVLFVCLGNICRSPTAHGVFQQRVVNRQLQHLISVDSAGTAAWHCGKPPDRRAAAAAQRRGYDLSALRARQATEGDFEHFHYILAMDRDNLRELQAIAPDNYQGELGLFLEYGHNLPLAEVPDPYYGGVDGFEAVLDLVEAASAGLLEHILARHTL